MRKKAYVILLCIFFFVVFARSQTSIIKAQTPTPTITPTPGFAKLAPKNNEILWNPNYSYVYTFRWQPSLRTVTNYAVRIYNAYSGGSLIKEYNVGTATSLTINFPSELPQLAHNTNYFWSLSSYNGSTLVEEADSPYSIRYAFRIPNYSSTVKSWTINATILCPAGTVLTTNVRPFWAAWTEFQNFPFDFSWQHGAYSKNQNITQTITNRTDNDTLYFGLESDQWVLKPLYYSGTSAETIELLPTGPWPWASNMDDQTKIYRTKAFNPYTNMAEWRWGLPNGSYSIPFAIPTPYDQQWCSVPTPTPICAPSLVSPINNANITTVPPTLTWTGCGTGGYYQVSVNGGGSTWTSPVLSQTSYTVSGFTFKIDNSYTWSVKKCTDSSCATTGPSTAGAFTYTCNKERGDANCDGNLNEADYTIWKCEYLGGGACTSPVSNKSADFNKDGKVDLVDFETWRANSY